MAARHDSRNAEKRKADGHNPWTTDDGHIATTSPAATTAPIGPTDDSHSQSQYGPPSSMTGGPPPGVIPAWVSQFLPVNTLATSTISTPSQETSHQAISTETSTTVASDDLLLPSTTVTPGFDGGPIGDFQRIQQSNNRAVYVAAGVIPGVVIGIIGFVVLFCIRKRRKQSQMTCQAQVPEMKFQQPTVSTYMASTIPVSRAPSYTAPVHNIQAPTSPSPVILGPIPAGSNGNYMTGIDTSDVLSTRNERTGLGDPFADGNSLHEEPPPPYKPRSLVSRNGSIRLPRSSMSMSSQNSHRSQRQRIQPLQNPFEDPREDDVVSAPSSPTLLRHLDNMSAVSDLSYQQDLDVGRRAGRE